MALWTRSMEDRRAFRCLFCLAMLYGLASWLVYTVLHMRHVLPLGPDAPLDRFSEARAVDHVRQLTVGTGGRQEGSPGLELAAQYIKSQLEEIARNAGPSYRIEVEESLVSGSFSMYFLHHRVTLHYRNHKNVVMRISSNISEEHDSSFLVNGHYDSPLGSLGAGDCGSCVASMLELARLIVDSKWVPPQPIIFLFNGAEELFLLGSHGFITTHKWRDTIGAFIDIEASGSGGIDLVCQSGPSSWPTRVYAEVAQYPMANSVAQVLYSKDLAVILHTLPLGILLLVPFYLTFPTTALGSFLGAIVDVLKGMLFHFSSLILAIILPVIAAVVRLLFTQYSMSWFAHPFLAFFMFVPCSLVGLLLPKKLWSIKEETYYWGAYGLYVVMTMVYAISGSFGPQSLRSLAGYVVPLIPCLVYSVYYGGFLTQFVIEKMGMMGSLPQPYGYFVPDVIIAAVIGLVTGWSVGPILPVTSQWLARSSIINFLLQITVVVLALASQLFPYSTSAPKRVVFQHTFVTADSSKIEESSYGFFGDKYLSDRSSWVAIYPVSFLFTGSLKFPAKENEILEHYKIFPSLSILETVPLSEPGQRRIHLELHLGSLSQIWGERFRVIACGSSSTDQYLTTSASELKSLFPDWADVTAYSTFFSSYEF
ncbi:Endoplasmic reticulum metallopeptidase 1 [Rhynchospora pubera]|uniref:Endoplasmic reticulum metallopeptidase 1 n=1 Tax=Rhynchospora pubera TaxID=906938 RepID=A0AAV8AQM4_9POAL|nr:Endoplasmic reticulum metallopeptidase 1 [Rhynchospora pubera]